MFFRRWILLRYGILFNKFIYHRYMITITLYLTEILVFNVSLLIFILMICVFINFNIQKFRFFEFTKYFTLKTSLGITRKDTYLSSQLNRCMDFSYFLVVLFLVHSNDFDILLYALSTWAGVVGAVVKISAFRSQGPQFDPRLCQGLK